MLDNEVLFRGKRTSDGRWVVGYYSGPGKAKVDSHWISDAESPFCTPYQVDPRTVGQYTGLRDRNGARIFVGDILRPAASGGALPRYAVEMGSVTVTLAKPADAGEYGSRVRITGVLLVGEGQRRLPGVDENGLSDTERMEVVGNIHDGPDSIKQ